MSKDLIERGKGVLRLCHISAVIVAVAVMAGLATSPAAAMPVTEGYSSGGLSTGCPCGGGGSVPTATPTPVPQVTDEQQAGCPCSGGGDTIQPSPAAAPAATITSAADQQATADNISAGTGEQSASVASSGNIAASELKAISFPTILGSTDSGSGGFSPATFRSFTLPRLKTGETAGETPADGRGSDLIGRFKFLQKKNTDEIRSTNGSRWKMFST